MAFEISLIGSAQRLQAQRDKNADQVRVQQRDTDVQRAYTVEQQRQSRRLEQQRSADTAANDLRTQRAQVDNERQRVTYQQRQDARGREIADRVANKAVDQNLADQKRLDDIQRTRDDRIAAERSREPLTSTVPPPPAPTVQDVSTSASTSPAAYEQALTERNNRLADQADANRRFAESQQRDYTNSVRSIDNLRANPIDQQSPSGRGSVVDFRA